ncbi:hypothetical protein M3J09_012974 [Ascochyta lentis]
MCFDDRTRYTTKTHIQNGVRYREEVTTPRHRSSWRRRYGASYYPSRYYARPPRVHYPSGGGMLHPARYAANTGYPQAVAMVPRGYACRNGGYMAGGRALMPSAYNMRSYYNTMPTYGQTAYVYPPGPTTTTYHVTNSHVPVTTAPPRTTTCPHTTTREDLQMENRRIATERGAYSARKIKPADARDDDPFWCRERNGEWHLRTFYQIENECHPGQWLMDAELGFLVFHRG